MFTKNQRLAIRKRDNNKCQGPMPHICQGRWEVHHIIPRRYGKTVFGLTEDELDVPENAILLCANAHKVIHPDLDYALRHYHQLKSEGFDSFKLMGEDRVAKLQKHQVYWRTDWDRVMLTYAFQRTVKAMRRGWKFPEHKRRTK